MFMSVVVIDQLSLESLNRITNSQIHKLDPGPSTGTHALED
jgi:hypothetical protein